MWRVLFPLHAFSQHTLHRLSVVVTFPPCKINLGLRITKKRTDGYHDLETCFYPLPLTDVLEVIPSTTLAFTTSGIPIPGHTEDNLCLRAYHLLQADFSLPPVRLHLHKIIPTGAGIGGGSADAAYTLRLLNDRFALGLGDAALASYAARLGSDCAFFIYNKPMLGTGRGEILTPLSLSLQGKFVVLVKPPIHVSTAEAFAGVKPSAPAEHLETLLAHPLHTWRTSVVNDFEASIFQRYPAIAARKEKLYAMGARYASMSGSGAAVFGIFEEDPKVDFRGDFCWKGRL